MADFDAPMERDPEDDSRFAIEVTRQTGRVLCALLQGRRLAQEGFEASWGFHRDLESRRVRLLAVSVEALPAVERALEAARLRGDLDEVKLELSPMEADSVLGELQAILRGQGVRLVGEE